jgi:hypothetical protein
MELVRDAYVGRRHRALLEASPAPLDSTRNISPLPSLNVAMSCLGLAMEEVPPTGIVPFGAAPNDDARTSEIPLPFYVFDQFVNILFFPSHLGIASKACY